MKTRAKHKIIGQYAGKYPGGGLSRQGRWRASHRKSFLPVRVLSRKFRGKLLPLLKQAGLPLPSELYAKEWVVYCKPPFKHAAKVIEYLGRYTHRVAISNSRILVLKDGRVTFVWRDYRDENRKKTMTVTASEFIHARSFSGEREAMQFVWIVSWFRGA